MPTLHRYKLFVSHAWSYSERYTSMVSLLNNSPNFIYSNFSVPTDKAFEGMTNAQLEEQLKRQIRPVEVVIIIGGMYVAHSDWIQKEIDFAKSISKPILGVRPRGATRMPTAVTDVADEVVYWTSSSIVAGIRNLS